MTNLKDFIRTYPDFPTKGVLFRDINPLLRNSFALSEAINQMACDIANVSDCPNVIVAPEARGFYFGVPVAYTLGLPFVPVRKPGKIPGDVIEQEYSLEYNTSVLTIPAHSIQYGDKVAIVDDVLATGGTIQAIIKLIERMGGEVVCIHCLIELIDLKGRDALQGYDVHSILTF